MGMTKLTVAFRKFVNTPNTYDVIQLNFFLLSETGYTKIAEREGEKRFNSASNC